MSERSTQKITLAKLIERHIFTDGALLPRNAGELHFMLTERIFCKR